MSTFDNNILLLVSAVFGLVVGSFLNVAINRTKLSQSFGGRSHCPRCKHELSVWDLVPVLSFIFLGGRCRYCGKNISVQYPLVELLTATVFFCLATLGVPLWELLFLWIISAVLIVIAVYDLKHFLILDKFVFTGLVIAVLYAISRDYAYGCQFPMNCATISGLVGAVIISGFFYLQHLISKGRWIGFGDVKFGLFMGMTAGFPVGVLSLFLAYMSGAVIGMFLVSLQKKELGSRMPFGTFLASATIFGLIYGHRLLDWYLELIGFPPV
ncbi:MAG TPA: prepilin peptidase [Candidatus Binatia bacterium]|nr:prepilin peptidase [Candidatus Binatia bacterium]